jgi:hypothetical protein
MPTFIVLIGGQIAFHRLQGIFFFEMFVFILPGYTREIVRLLYNSQCF